MIRRVIAPSILSGDFAQLSNECNRMIEYGADWLHVDIMDGHFVPNLTIGPPVVKSIRRHTKAFLDCHLMVSNPDRWIEDFAKAGASQYTFHYEASPCPSETIKGIKKAGMLVGIAIKPGTKVEMILPLVDQVDMVLVMTVEPGFGGQSLIPECIEKVRQLRNHKPSLDIQVDGGITLENLPMVTKAGANIIVAGTLIFNASSPKKMIEDMRIAMSYPTDP